MANIEKLKFHIIDVSENTYLSWCLDVELQLQGQDLETLMKDGKYIKNDEMNSLIFICRHLLDCIKCQYLQVRKPSTLWKKLKEWYDHTSNVMLPRHNMVRNI